ncbi:germination protein [Fervidicella metallireducens AeB]|uniref:Germination protein n=1 Tax=Fervidicella metallireducens AeB TaxID=1403537 RepID=A0A017RYX0_9CLOT|nr:germination protein YpeB [Fervidicella metallireducens]EYE89791.1 germination protein [Fervidicella metallireducens AeB]
MFKKRAVLAVIVSLIVVGSSTFGTLMYLDRRDYRNYLQNQYQKNLYDVISNVENLQVALSKATVTASPRQSLILFGEIWKESSAAQDKLNALPITHVAISQTSKFLSQVADFSLALVRANNRGQELTDEEWKNVEKLKDFSGYLSMQLKALQQEVSDGKIKWGEIKHKGRKLFAGNIQNTVDVKFEGIASEMQQYPTLIYDGPFSENVLNIKPRILSEKKITLEEAKKIAAQVIGKEKVQETSLYSNKTGEKIPCYAIAVKIKGRKDSDINIDISKNGGKVIYMLDSREVKEAKIKMKDAIEKGTKFLEKLGYKDMIPTFSLRYDNVAVINYVYVKNKVVVYPDQIKLKVALDNGDIVGIESQHFLIAHYDRKIQSPKITLKDAKKSVSNRLNIKNIRLCIIPMESLREVFCYEFYGDYNGEKYIIYINAFDGEEERILKILETPNGELTM